jgi:transposase
MIRVNLTETQRQDLGRRARREMGRISERHHFVLLADQGRSPPEIARLYGYNTTTVRYWLGRYLSRGASGLHDEPRSGRPAG